MLKTITDEFLDSSNPPKLNHEGANYLNRAISKKDIEAVKESLSTKKKSQTQINSHHDFIRFSKKIYN